MSQNKREMPGGNVENMSHALSEVSKDVADGQAGGQLQGLDMSFQQACVGIANEVPCTKADLDELAKKFDLKLENDNASGEHLDADAVCTKGDLLALERQFEEQLKRQLENFKRSNAELQESTRQIREDFDNLRLELALRGKDGRWAMIKAAVRLAFKKRRTGH